ncbi:Bug family tripartite tricarboxylate transporter substrate binding protein [Ramlibacter sp. MAHUQ-53]|uniref:Bug family tripartite tricarboxylate transporter substrate binding protein n=1 Tax=unclassified Ramlibacter TaxID=2617605 RepID=UPI0036294500
MYKPLFAGLIAGLVVAAAAAQDYPTRSIRMVVPFAAGGGADLVARAIATPLGKRLGQPVVIDNKPGGGATLGADLVAKSAPDGYTILYTTPGPQMTNPHLQAKLPYDPEKDLVPVSRVAVVPNVLVVPRDLPVKTVQELVQYAKERPGRVNYASAGNGASSHLAGELFKQSAGVFIVHIPYRGTSAALADLVSGQVQMAIDSIPAYKPLIDSGALRPLGVATPERSALLPSVPTIAETLKGFDAAPVNYISVPARTPQAVIDRLNREINAVLQSPELREQFAGMGVIPQGGTPAEMAATIRSESEKWKKVIRFSGAKLD